MKFRKIIIFINICLLVLSFNVLANNEGTKNIGNYDKWSVYAKSKSLCYMISQPENSEGEYTIRGKVRLVVYRNKNKKDHKYVVGIDFGYPFPDESRVLVEIDNKKIFKLNTFGQTAWTGLKSKFDKEIIKEMTKGNTLIAFGVSKRGTKTKDTYSLSGFGKAFKKITSYCG